MWNKIAVFIIRQRVIIAVVMLLITAIMAGLARKVELVYSFQRVVPLADEDYQNYLRFKETYGEDGTVLIIGAETDKIFTPNFIKGWDALSRRIDSLTGVREVLSLTRLFDLRRDDSIGQFALDPFPSIIPATQEDVDSFAARLDQLRFYKNLIYFPEKNLTLMLVTLRSEELNSDKRVVLASTIRKFGDEFADTQGIKLHYSGLPYIRSLFSAKVANEFKNFTLLALLVTGIILFLFFRSATALVYSVLSVVVSVIWSVGFIVLFGYKVGVLTGLVPPIIVIISITNSVYLINKFHAEYRSHQNHALALARVVNRVGKAAFLTNLTTAIGFGVFVFTGSEILQEFGTLSFFAVLSLFFISILGFPIVFSILPPPKARHVRHLNYPIISKVVDYWAYWVNNRRPAIFIVTAAVAVTAFIGASKLRAFSYLIDDIPQGDPISEDIKFFEERIGGVMPFEIEINTGEPNGIKDLATLQRIERMQREISEFPEFSRPLSITELLKFAHQAYYNDKRRYILPSALDINKISNYIPSGGSESRGVMKSLLDSTYSRARISVQMADVGSTEVERIRNDVQAKADSIFEGSGTKVTLTGSTILFLKGNRFLIENLAKSLIIALLIISILMMFLFGHFNMILIALVPNLIPLLLTAGIMGYAGVPLKPSTVLIFSIAFGIAVDFTIHFVARFRMDMRITGGHIRDAVNMALKETGPSMLYTVVILFFGFSLFAFSSFGGTVWLGILTSLTLIFALGTNVLLMPSLLVALENRINRKALLKKQALEIDHE